MLTVSGSEQVAVARNTSGVILKLSGISPAVYQCIHSTFISQIERVRLEFAGEVVTMKHESYPYVLYNDSVPIPGTVTLNQISTPSVQITTHFSLSPASHCHKISRRAPRQRFLSTNHIIRYFLANHNCRGVQIPGDNLRHNRRIHHTQAF